MDRTPKHSPGDMLTIAICAVICGADGWVQIEMSGNSKNKGFETFLDLPNGIASHDTFGRLFAKLDPRAFEKASWPGSRTGHRLAGPPGIRFADDDRRIRKGHGAKNFARPSRIALNALITEGTVY